MKTSLGHVERISKRRGIFSLELLNVASHIINAKGGGGGGDFSKYGFCPHLSDFFYRLLSFVFGDEEQQ